MLLETSNTLAYKYTRSIYLWLIIDMTHLYVLETRSLKDGQLLIEGKTEGWLAYQHNLSFPGRRAWVKDSYSNAFFFMKECSQEESERSRIGQGNKLSKEVISARHKLWSDSGLVPPWGKKEQRKGIVQSHHLIEEAPTGREWLSAIPQSRECMPHKQMWVGINSIPNRPGSSREPKVPWHSQGTRWKAWKTIMRMRPKKEREHFAKVLVCVYECTYTDVMTLPSTCENPNSS